MFRFLKIIFILWLAPRLMRAFLWFGVILAILAVGAFSWGRSVLTAIGIDWSNFPLIWWLACVVIFAIIMVSQSGEYPRKQPSKSKGKAVGEVKGAPDRHSGDYAGRMKQYRNEAERFLASRKNLK